MKKLLLTILVTLAFMPAVFANGNAEKLTTFEGEAVFTPDAGEQTTLMLQLRDGLRMQVCIEEAELARLQIRDRDQIRIEGVYLGETDGNQEQARIFARVITMNGKTFMLENPVRLSEQEQLQVKAYESEQKSIQTENRNQAGPGGTPSSSQQATSKGKN
jgi:hypothetical protein